MSGRFAVLIVGSQLPADGTGWKSMGRIITPFSILPASFLRLVVFLKPPVVWRVGRHHGSLVGSKGFVGVILSVPDVFLIWAGFLNPTAFLFMDLSISSWLSKSEQHMFEQQIRNSNIEIRDNKTMIKLQ